MLYSIDNKDVFTFDNLTNFFKSVCNGKNIFNFEIFAKVKKYIISNFNLLIIFFF